MLKCSKSQVHLSITNELGHTRELRKDFSICSDIHPKEDTKRLKATRGVKWALGLYTSSDI